MKLSPKYSTMPDEYFCELTDELDRLAKIDNPDTIYKHYIYADGMDIKIRIIAIRVPGGTVGSIWLDKNNAIKEIHVDTNYVIQTYPDNINDILKKYIGTVLEF